MGGHMKSVICCKRIHAALFVGGLLAACGGEQSDDELDASAPVRKIELDELEIVHADRVGVPTFANGKLGKIDVRGTRPALRDEDAGLRPVLASLRDAFHIDPNELVLDRATTDNIGDRHYVFKQFKHGLEVIGASLVLHTRSGNIYAVHGKARADLDTPVAVPIDAAKAVAVVADDAAQV